MSPIDTVEERRAPIDIFFRTLADAHHDAAIAVVLSGSGADGSSGIKRIKEQAGLVIAEDPDEADYADMPLNAIRSGLVDYVLKIAAMPAQILAYHGIQVDVSLGRESQDGRAQPSDDLVAAPFPSGFAGLDPHQAELYRNVLTLLRVRTGHDFSNYKAATVLRRIARRMRLHQVGDLARYAARLRDDPAEPAALMKELLISVTNFFRDPEVFAALEARVIPRLFERKSGQDQVRAWVAGCATGEEAYSIAMLLAECRDSSIEQPSIQVFATDLDQQAIAVARDGLYNEVDVADVSPARLHRFFQREGSAYRARRELRELILFAHHNAIKDPPFSHLDLISCRNVLIYLNRSVQERLLETFHFALRAGGYLLLGTSESCDGASDLFATVDKAAHIYDSRPVSTRLPPHAEVMTASRARPEQAIFSDPRGAKHVFPADLHMRLLEEYAAPSLVVSEDFAVVHLSEAVGEFLELHGGEPSRDLFKLLRSELRVDVRIALRRALQERRTIEVAPLPLDDDPGSRMVRVVVRPVLGNSDPARGYFLLLFEAADEAEQPLPQVMPSDRGPATLLLNEELDRVKEQLRNTVEQYETQVEEARAANEELQALNEELRSSAEELETSKEELQSVNEELTTVNQELKIKIEELRLTNDDFQNFINATDVATIFVDRSLRVKLSTLQARQIFNLLPSDTGRRLSDITSKLGYPGLTDDLTRVVDSLQPIERQVPSTDGRTLLVRMRPYRTVDNRIEGAVLTCLDITARVADEKRIRSGEERLRLLIATAQDYAIFTMNQDGIVDSWNAGAERMFGYTAGEIVGSDTVLLFTPEDRAAGVPAGELERAARDGRASDERVHIRKDGTRFYCSGVTTRLGEGFGFAKIARDLTAQRNAELALQQAHDSLDTRVRERTRELQEEVARGEAARTQVMSLVRQVVTAQEDERGRVARDLHDHFGQQLTALRLSLEEYRRVAPPEGLAPLDRALTVARAIDEEVDFLAWQLRPALLDDLGLAAALPKFLEQWAEHTGIAAEFRIGQRELRLPSDVEVSFYRVAQEALNNIAKHAHASRADVLLESRGAEVVLVVEDDGIGFDAGDTAAMQRGIGLLSMRERAGLAGARLEVESAVGQGTSVFLRWARRPANAGVKP